MKSQGKTIIKRNTQRTIAESVGMQAVFLILGFMFQRSKIIGGIYPFGVALVSASPIAVMLSASSGCIAGSFFSGSYLDGARYISAIALINIVRYFMMKAKVKNTELFSLFSSGISLAVVLLVISIMMPFSFEEIMLYVAEILLSCGSAYFLQRTLKIFFEKESLRNLSRYDMTGIVVIFSIGLISISNIDIFSISPARIISVIAILLFSAYGSVSAGTVVGITTGFALSLSPDSFTYIAGGYAIGSLVSGIFSKLGTIACAVSFLVANIITGIAYSLSDYVIISIYEVLIGGCIFLALPKQLSRQIVSTFEGPIKAVSVDGFKRGVLMKLDFAGAALSDVSDSVEAVAHKLRRTSNPVMDDVFKNVKRDICNGCSRYRFCYKEKRQDREKDFKLMQMTLKEYGKMELAYLPTDFAEQCEKSREFSDKACEYYTKLIMKKSANDRVDEFRSIVVDQFKNLSDMLFEMSESVSKSESTDPSSEEKIFTVLKEMGYEVLDVSANIGNENYMTVEVRLRDNGRELKGSSIIFELSRATGRKFEAFSKTVAGEDVLVSVCEKAELSCDFAVTQHNCNNSDLCGDSYGFFYDGRGRAILILSDGMGSGGRAAVDGAMAAGLMSRLIRAGIRMESAIKIVNSAMLYKSSDESLATLDICEIDLYSGNGAFYKAGAAKSFIISKRNIIEVESKSMPIGILKDVHHEKSNVKLISGDIILMFSDGVTDVEGDWLMEEIEAFDGDNLQNLTDIIATKAKVKRKLYDDDITVMAVRVNRSDY